LERPGGVSHTGGEARPHESADWLRATIDLAPIGIAHVALDGRFLFANEYLCTLLGHSREALLERTFQGVTHADDLATCMALNAQLAVGQRRNYRHELRLLRADASAVRCRISMSAAPLEGSGEPMFLVAIAEELSEREARAHAEQLLAVVAHDLRSPLTNISLAASAVMKILPPDDESTRQLAIMQRSASSMDRLISDLLDVARIEAGTFEVRRARVLVSPLLQEVCEQFEAAAREREITLASDMARGVRAASGDRDRLVQVLSNLIANALKFTPPKGTVSVHAELSYGFVQISVQDTGPGVDPDSLPHIFERFWQADRTSSSGAGLGLQIAKGIVEAHGGRIWADSTPGQGTTFHFTVPARG
jgi:PAS domain S-box-containing protein